MPDPAYLAGALGAAVAITVTLRALPFVVKGAIAESPLLANIGRWMPLGAVGILAVYCLAQIDLSPGGLAQVVGVAVTVVIHWWRRNAVLSIVAGTAACLALTNWALA
ncbi:branched-chain amino acid transporter permease [Cryptosporangium sp. NPDC048952]|uniref:branched-chain amino acid transporter permease n=1 Tax=Cryptosporangium sp. NPDC048952 TaxID=3363961 RepID=UPI00372124DF